MLKSLRVALAVLLSMSLGSDAFALGTAFIGNEVTSARAGGQGYVGVAGQNSDPATVFVNPAAMTSLPGTQVTLGGTWENIHGAYQDDAGNTTKERVVNVVVPNFAATQSLMDGKLAVGLASESPFGLETNWDGNSPLRYVATVSRLRMIDITPAVAYKVSPMFSVGAGADYDNVFDAQLDNHVNNDFVNDGLFLTKGLGAITSGTPDAISSLRGTGANWGYHAGVTFQPTEQHAIGITYHSKVNIRILGNETITGINGPASTGIFGGSTYSSSAYTDIVLPSSVQFGYAFKPTGKWHFEADAAWTHWSEARNLDVRFPTGSLLSESVTPLDARDTWDVATGVNYKMNDTWEFRGGFWYLPWVIPEQNFSPAFNDLTRYGLTTGTGYHLNQNLTIDLAYNAVFFHNRTIHNSIAANSTGITPAVSQAFGLPNPDISGTYKDFANLLALNVTYRFGSK